MMHFGNSLSPFGHEERSWQTAASQYALGFPALLQQVLDAERAGFDFVLLRDRDGRRPTDTLSPRAVPFEPTLLVSALATRTEKIGFLVAAATYQHEPYNLARRFASLELISHGRSGWLVLGSDDSARDREYVDVVSGLWDSWEDDAFIYDKADGRFFRPEKMHVLNHRGEHFSVRGPMNVNRSPQGKPVLARVFGPETALNTAGFAEVIIVEDRSTLSDLVRMLEELGRPRSEIRIMANITRLAGDPVAVADDLQRQFESEDIDGFVLSLPTTAMFSAFLTSVVPELIKRGLMRSGYTGSTLRENLGLPRPAHPASLERAS
jgi:alkanesulfonate monooxygenase SsuD/methylene tetrahydromethanopterin reductase-like flavin-dependent oxidoreductase (luciferase family)